MMHSWFRPYIEGIRNQPGWYLRGVPTLLGLATHVDGYLHARRCLGRDLSTEDDDFIQSFEEWLRARADWKGPADWATLAGMIVGEQDSLTGFYELWDRFHEERGIARAKGNIWGSEGPQPPIVARP